MYILCGRIGIRYYMRFSFGIGTLKKTCVIQIHLNTTFREQSARTSFARKVQFRPFAISVRSTLPRYYKEKTLSKQGLYIGWQIMLSSKVEVPSAWARKRSRSFLSKICDREKRIWSSHRTPEARRERRARWAAKSCASARRGAERRNALTPCREKAILHAVRRWAHGSYRSLPRG